MFTSLFHYFLDIFTRKDPSSVRPFSVFATVKLHCSTSTSIFSNSVLKLSMALATLASISCNFSIISPRFRINPKIYNLVMFANFSSEKLNFSHRPKDRDNVGHHLTIIIAVACLNVPYLQ
jgi:hypothetical protein